MAIVTITTVIKKTSAGAAVLALAGCGVFPEDFPVVPDVLKEQDTGRFTGLPPAQSCDRNEVKDKNMTGALLRQSEAAGFAFDIVYVTGRSSRLGLAPEISFADRSDADLPEEIEGAVFRGSRKSTATQRSGFGPDDTLPNVYDITYSVWEKNFSGPVVLGPGAVGAEIPTTGASTFSGRIALQLITADKDGNPVETSATGSFSLRAGYGSGRASFAASGFDADLPFDSLTWENLFLCGTRFVSSGKGVVSVRTGDGPALPPFKTGREPVPFTAVFESSQFAPEERPGPPVAAGGVFAIESDAGTLTAVFLSDLPPAVEDEEEAG
ncbi:hypothetical protein [uncultured Roseobacter sp.]|uniref:hypothetical protein n=1 Tax=uncultured Roseobacter sp. TaxID=114847 RepID=UPI00262F073D|nr:hypothetical protein [uncultured Roseobacter sp.]